LATVSGIRYAILAARFDVWQPGLLPAIVIEMLPASHLFPMPGARVPETIATELDAPERITLFWPRDGHQGSRQQPKNPVAADRAWADRT
jgi:hypothetical protein